MKKGYIPKDKRKKILLLCDDLRAHSGIGHMARELVVNTAHHYNWVNVGGAMKHPEEGKRLDLCESTNKETGLTDSSVYIYPVSGYGTPDIIRSLIKIEKPDAIWLITDPRYWTWLFAMGQELTKKLPIIYLNIWDNYPAPLYNKPFYESCDLLLGISKQTVNINKLVLGEDIGDRTVRYLPHGVSKNTFRPLEPSKELDAFKAKLFKDKDIKFTFLFNSRNIRRKRIPDTIEAYKIFVDSLPVEERKHVLLLLHTAVSEENGTDLKAVVDLLCPEEDGYNVHFTGQNYNPQEMNMLYNSTDCTILLSSNEGWGLSLTESLLTGRPFIANVTGGMQDQMRFEDENGDWLNFDENLPSNHRKTYVKCGPWAFPVFPSSITLEGSIPTPYIYDDRCNAQDAALAMQKVYITDPERRREIGELGRQWALGDEANFTSQAMAENAIKYTDELFEKWKPRPNYEVIKIKKLPVKKLKHNLQY